MVTALRRQSEMQQQVQQPPQPAKICRAASTAAELLGGGAPIQSRPQMRRLQYSSGTTLSTRGDSNACCTRKHYVAAGRMQGQPGWTAGAPKRLADDGRCRCQVDGSDDATCRERDSAGA